MFYSDSTSTPFDAYNVAVGYKALEGSTNPANNTGRHNTAIGVLANHKNTSGENNTSVGIYALEDNTSGKNNTALGYSAYSNKGNYSNSTGLGFNAEPNGNNVVRIGNMSVGTIGEYAEWTTVSSDARIKTDVKENIPGIAMVNKLRPVTYHLDMDAIARIIGTPDSLRLYDAEASKSAEEQIGLIAQEVEQAANELGFEFHAIEKPKGPNSHYGLRYSEFVPVLVKAIQEQQSTITAQQELIHLTRRQNAQLESRLSQIEAQMTNLTKQ